MQSLDDLVTCSSATLGDHLTQHRFDGNADATAKFLRAAADAVIAQSVVASENAMDIGDCLHDNDNSDGDENAITTVSSLQPRGKLRLMIGTQGVRLGGDDATAGFMVRPNTVRACVVFPKPEECRKAKSVAADMVCFALSEEITYKSKPYSQLCFQLPAKPKNAGETNGGVSEDHTSKWMVLFQKSLNFGDYERVYHPKNKQYGNLNAFQSHSDDQTSSTSAGMPYVSCYHLVNEGVIFLLNTALLFYKPVKLWTMDQLEAPPVVGSTSSRYIGVSFQLKDFTTVNLTNISSHERNGLDAFLVEAFGTDYATNKTKNVQGQEDNLDDDDDDGSLSNEPPASTRRSRKRKAAVQASTINKRMVWQGGDAEEEEEQEDPDVTFDDDDNSDDDDETDGSDNERNNKHSDTTHDDDDESDDNETDGD